MRCSNAWIILLKVTVGGDPDCLERLEENKKQYRELIQVFTKNIEQGKGHRVLDEKGVDERVNSLYNLPHYGEMLRQAVKVVEITHANTCREKPYYVPPKKGNNFLHR